MKLLYKRTEEELGAGPCILKWKSNGAALAVAGANRAVILYDRKGEIIDALDMTGKITCVEWDKEGDVLAVTMTGSSMLTLWDVNSRDTDQIDTGTGAREIPTCLAWSPVQPILAAGNSSGNLFIYNHKNARKLSLLGKHQKSITDVKVTKDDKIITLAEDNNIIISNLEGDSLFTSVVGQEPSHMKIGEVKKPGSNTETVLSCILSRNILMLTRLNDLEAPVNLQFQERYGHIVDYAWFNDGYVVLGFDRGFTVCISAHQSELGSELYSITDYKTYFGGVAVSQAFGKIFSIGDHQIKVREMADMQDLFAMIEVDTEKDLCCINASEDGQMVAVASESGNLFVYLTRMPALAAAYNDVIAVLSGLNQISVLPEADKTKQVSIDIEIEPIHIGVGPRHVAACINNRIWFYEYHSPNYYVPGSANEQPSAVSKFDYLSTIIGVKLNYEYAAVIMEGKVRLHKIVEREGDDQTATFPEPSRNANLLAADLTDHFLIFSTDTNYIVYFSIEEWAVVSEYRHTSPVRQLFPDPDGIRSGLFDERLDSWIYSPVDDSMNKLPPYKGGLWETFTIDRDTFVVYDQHNIYVFLLAKGQIEKEKIVYIGATKLPFGNTPLILSKGIVYCITSSGKPSGVLLESHRTDTILEGKSQEVVQSLLDQALKLRRWTYAWKICEFTKNLAHWNLFAQAALVNTNVEIALKIFHHIGDVSMVLALEQLLLIEEKNLLWGQIALFLGRFDQAETLLLSSSQPLEALYMRRYLMEWSKALTLAEKLAPQEIPSISKDYAQQLELLGDYPTALVHYEQGIVEESGNQFGSPIELQEHNETCNSGIARTSIRTGDIRRGVQLAKELEGRVVKRDCAIILEQIKQYSEAAELYEIGQFYDRAAAVCIKAKAWGKVGELLLHVKSPKIHAQYGKIMESEKKYKQAALAFENAKDYDNLVRILLDHLNAPEEAVKVVRDSRSVEGAKLVAKFFSKLGDHASAIQFLVMSQCVQEAFQLAENHDCMRQYAEAISECGTSAQMTQLAEYFVAKGDAFNAGKFHLKAGHYSTALEYLISSEEDPEAIKMAIECAEKANDKQVTHRLIAYLMGDVDGSPKDAEYLFRLYVALNMVREAAKTAVIVSREHQDRGSYRVARDVLFAMYNKLLEKKIKIPLEMQNSLMLIHSYLIVKPLVHRKEMLKAARMLIRTANNISRFPSHVVQILTSTVVVCHQAGLKMAAFHWATQLMQPEHRNKIDKKYKRSVENIVRKTEKVADSEEPRSPCPFCKAPVPESELSCSKCKNTIAYCIVTGRHVIEEDFALCPECKFPGFYSEFKKIAALDEACPMCKGNLRDVLPADIAIITNLDKPQATLDA